MGIKDLLKIFKPIMTRVHISDFQNKTIAVDMMTWLYRGVYACCEELNNDIQSDLYLNYPLKMISMLSKYNIKIIAVFDGKDLKAKEGEERQREHNKVKNLELAAVIEATGETETARKVSKRALTVNQKMVNTLIAILKELKIKIITAPYEADAQIAYLCKSRLCDYAISEDSDLIAFGCSRILYKMQPSGEALYFDWDKFKNMTVNMSSIINTDKDDDINTNYNSNPSLTKDLIVLKRMKFINFLEFCVMLGCDYLDSIKGFGVKGGLKLFLTYSNLEIVYHQIKNDKKYIDKISKFNEENEENYLMKAKKVVSLFLLQTVYNPLSNTLVPLNNLNLNEEFNNAVSKYRLSFSSSDSKEEFYGAFFDDYEEFCNNNKPVNPEEIESEEVINKYYVKYKDLVKQAVFVKPNDIGIFNSGLIGSNPEFLQLDEDFINAEMEIENYQNNKSLNLTTVGKPLNQKNKGIAFMVDDEELERLFRSAKKENIEETKEKMINKKVEELVKLQVKDNKPITSLGDLINEDFSIKKINKKVNTNNNEKFKNSSALTSKSNLENSSDNFNNEVSKENLNSNSNNNNNSSKKFIEDIFNRNLSASDSHKIDSNSNTNTNNNCNIIKGQSFITNFLHRKKEKEKVRHALPVKSTNNITLSDFFNKNS
jgi:exonuclease-1